MCLAYYKRFKLISGSHEHMCLRIENFISLDVLFFLILVYFLNCLLAFSISLNEIQCKIYVMEAMYSDIFVVEKQKIEYEHI